MKNSNKQLTLIYKRTVPDDPQALQRLAHIYPANILARYPTERVRREEKGKRRRSEDTLTDGENRDNYTTWNQDDKKHDDQDYDALGTMMLLMPTIAIMIMVTTARDF